MSQAVIVSVARTPIGRAYKGAFNAIKSPTLLGHAIGHAVARAGAGPDEVDDVVVGTVLGAGTAGMNLARNAALAAGLGVAVSGQTLDRQCASGLMAVATAAKQIIVDGMRVVVAGGQENISAVQKGYFDWASAEADPAVQAKVPHAYMPMLQTAEFVARKYGIGREAQDLYALQSQQRTAAAQQAGRFDAEIVPLPSRMAVVDKETQAVSHRDVTLAQDEGNRPETTLESLAALKPVIEGGSVTAGNASQLSDGAAACVLMDDALAAQRGLKPLGIYRGIGLEIALRAARDGANVVIAAKTTEPHPKLPGTIYTAAEAVEQAGGKALALVLDVRDEERVKAAVAQAAEHFGGIDACINNASAINLAKSEDIDLKRFDLIQQINMRGTFVTSRACIPYLRQSSNPHILALSPPLTLRADWFAQHLPYTMSKYGMSMVMFGLAEELREACIACNALWPRTTVATSAVEFALGGDAMLRQSRNPQIMADAAHAILCRPARAYTGNFVLDDDVLAEEGVTDFDRYRNDPASALLPDIFVDPEAPLPPGSSYAPAS